MTEKKYKKYVPAEEGCGYPCSRRETAMGMGTGESSILMGEI